MASIAEKYRVAPADRQELRFATVMTGGVSLAVWMGGATHELNRLVRRDDDVYAQLLDLTGATARVDVVAGTSAGGLNGALLATAQVHDSDLSGLRALWLDKGALESLLRSPVDKDPPSLMLGDDYFLPGIREALEGIVNRPLDRLPPVDRVPVHLLITSTLLGGRHRGVPDSYGSIIPDLDHRGLFTFRRGRGQVHHRPGGCSHSKGGHGERGDDWAEPGTLERIALAARSTASFPFAFEPSFCPIDDSPDDQHPDMACHANFPVSRWAVDGGVLVNRPLGPALEAIFAQEATRQVRRVLAYLVPDPGIEQKDLPDERDSLPTLAQVAYASLLSLPRNQSVSTELNAIRDHNARVAGQRRRRQAAVDAHTRLLPLAEGLYERYRRIRAEQVADRFVDLIAEGAVTEPGLRRQGGMPLWDRAALRGPFVDQLSVVPPSTFPVADGEIAEWFTTLDALERAGALALDLLLRPLRLANPLGRETSDADRRTLQDLRGQVHAALREGRDAMPRLTPAQQLEVAADAREALSHRVLEERAQTLIARVLGSPRDLWPQMERIASAVREGAPVALRVAAGARDTPTGRRGPAEPVEEAEALARAFSIDGAQASQAAVLWRMLALEVVQVALADQPPRVEQPVDLLQLSADVGNGFDSRAEPDQKLAGLQLGHFGAFYKRSWRANDWMWGRLDAVQRLTQVLIDPPRLRQLGYSVDDALAGIEEVAFAGLDADDRETLQRAQPRAWDRDVARGELSFLSNPDERPPASLPICAQAVARRLQIGILREELRTIAGAIDQDAESGGKSAAAQAFAAEVREAGPTPSAAELVRLFHLCTVGKERLEYDGSPLLARTASRATAVATSALGGVHSGLGRRAMTIRRGVRGVGLVLYLLVRNATAGTRIGAVAVIAAMAAAGALLAAGMLSGHGALATVGGALLLAGLGVATLRGRWRWGVLALVGAALLAALPRIAFEAADWPSEAFMDWFEIPWVAFWLIVGAVILGNIGVDWPEEDVPRPKAPASPP